MPPYSSQGKQGSHISGDFDTNLLRLENNTSHQEFYNLMVSFDFLPQILDPTKVTESSVTAMSTIIIVVILISISDCYSQFLSVERQKVDFKNVTMYR